MSWLPHPSTSGLCILFELKKAVDDGDIYQGMCELLLANWLSTCHRPVVVLTDLRDKWILLWLDGLSVCTGGWESRAAGMCIPCICAPRAPPFRLFCLLRTSTACLHSFALIFVFSLPPSLLLLLLAAAAAAAAVHGPQTLAVCHQSPCQALDPLSMPRATPTTF